MKILGLIVLSLTFIACEQDGGSDAKGTSLSNSDVASIAGVGTGMAQGMSDLAIAYDTTPPSMAKNYGASADPSNYTFNSSTNYWDLAETLSSTSGNSSFSYTYNMSVGMWDSGVLVQTPTTLSQVTMYGSLNMSATDGDTGDNMTLRMTIGDGISSPMTWSGIQTSTVSVNGVFQFDITYNNESVSMTMTFDNLSIDTSGSNTYPSGTLSISASAGGESFSGTVVYNGTSTAVATVNGESVNVDLSLSADAQLETLF